MYRLCLKKYFVHTSTSSLMLNISFFKIGNKIFSFISSLISPLFSYVFLNLLYFSQFVFLVSCNGIINSLYSSVLFSIYLSSIFINICVSSTRVLFCFSFKISSSKNKTLNIRSMYEKLLKNYIDLLLLTQYGNHTRI